MKMVTSDQRPATSQSMAGIRRGARLCARIVIVWVFCIGVVQLSIAYAQEPVTTPEPGAVVDTSAVSDDAVNAVAASLYCPVCENIPLDVCPTEACIQWREEIRIQLAEGQSEQQIITNFVDRYGDRVVGVPEDPLLRGLTLITPWLIGAVVLVAGVSILIRWRRGQRGTLATTTGTVSTLDDEASYRARLESDLVKRR